MKQWILSIALLAVAGVCSKETRAQAALNPNEYSGLSGANPTGSSTFTTLPSAPGVVFSQWSRGTGITPATGVSNTYSSTNFSTGTAGSSLASAISSGDSVYFTVTIQSNYTLTINSISWSTQRSSSGPTTAQWQYATAGGSYQNIDDAKDLSGSTNPQTVDVTPANPIVINGGSSGVTVRFRVVAWGASNAGGTFRINNGTSFNATASTPVPSPCFPSPLRLKTGRPS